MNLPSIARRAARKVALGADPYAIRTFHVPDGDGEVRLSCYLRSTTGRVLTVAGDIDGPERAFIRSWLRPGGHMVDVGANVGLYSLTAARAVVMLGAVWAFEPSAREIVLLLRNLTALGEKGGRVMVMPYALADRDAPGYLGVSDVDGINTIGRPTHPEHHPVASLRVYVATLDSFGIDRLDLLKIDAEGADGQVVLGAVKTIRRCRPAILCELCDTAMEAFDTCGAEVHDLVADMGYSWFEIGEDGTLHMHVRRDQYEYANLVALPRGGQA